MMNCCALNSTLPACHMHFRPRHQEHRSSITAATATGAKPHLQASLPELLNERRVLHCLSALTSDVVDAGLSLLHPSDVVLEAGHLLTRLGAVVPAPKQAISANKHARTSCKLATWANISCSGRSRHTGSPRQTSETWTTGDVQSSLQTDQTTAP